MQTAMAEVVTAAPTVASEAGAATVAATPGALAAGARAAATVAVKRMATGVAAGSPAAPLATSLSAHSTRPEREARMSIFAYKLLRLA